MSATGADWIIGRGLLGRAIERSLPNLPFRVAVPWGDEDAAVAALKEGVDEFLRSRVTPWRIYWCAGKGVTSATHEQLQPEVRVFRAFLSAVADAAPSGDGRIFLASSVGGAYAGRSDPPFTEATPPAPSSAYGHAKLATEESLRDWAIATGHRAFIARITNLYGPGQDLRKNQGLISTILRSYITQVPSTVYASLDTLRDYVYVDDCAAVVGAAMDRLGK